MELDAIGIVAKDIEESVRFYTLLGLKFPKTKASEDHVEAKTKSGLRVMIDSESLIKKLKPKWKKTAGQPIGLAFLCEDVDKTYKKIVDAFCSQFKFAAPRSR